jgi:uncharacterized membrane protein
MIMIHLPWHKVEKIIDILVLLLGILRRAQRPSATRGTLLPFYFPGGVLPLKKKIDW